MRWSLPLPANVQSIINLYYIIQNMPSVVLDRLYELDEEGFDMEGLGKLTDWSFYDKKQRIFLQFEKGSIFVPITTKR